MIRAQVRFRSSRVVITTTVVATISVPPDAADALHGKRRSSRLVQRGELLGTKDARQQTGTYGDEGHDEDGEADGGDGLRNGKSGTEADEFDEDKDPNGGPTLDVSEGHGGRGEGLVAREKDELGGDAVGLEGLDAHDEEEAGQHAVGDQMEDDEEGARHGA